MEYRDYKVKETTAGANPEVVDSLGCTEGTGYDKSEVDAVIAKLKAENERLEEKIREYKAREDVLVTDNRNLLAKVKNLENHLRENAEHFKRNEAQILERAAKAIAELKKKRGTGKATSTHSVGKHK